jgi:hypothetical protein
MMILKKRIQYLELENKTLVSELPEIKSRNTKPLNNNELIKDLEIRELTQSLYLLQQQSHQEIDLMNHSAKKRSYLRRK